jgi:RNA polymerase sigma-70 factor (ECF subfamily)
MTQQEWQAEQFEQHRAHLREVARRMLGSPAEAEDAVQEAWLRVSRTDTDTVENMRGWLTTVVSRICLDMLRSRRSRREQLVESWPAEPLLIVSEEGDPEAATLTADAVGLAMLVVLEQLAPDERLAFVLHDMFGLPFEEIAPIVERSVPATRQLASRARRRVRGAPAPHAPSRGRQRQIVEAFLAASREGDFEGLLGVLDPDVVLRAQSAPGGPPVPAELRGADNVARLVLARGTPRAQFGRPAIINGRPGAVVTIDGLVQSVVMFTIAGDRVVEMDLLVDLDGLNAVRL